MLEIRALGLGGYQLTSNQKLRSIIKNYMKTKNSDPRLERLEKLCDQQGNRIGREINYGILA